MHNTFTAPEKAKKVISSNCPRVEAADDAQVSCVNVCVCVCMNLHALECVCFCANTAQYAEECACIHQSVYLCTAKRALMQTAGVQLNVFPAHTHTHMQAVFRWDVDKVSTQTELHAHTRHPPHPSHPCLCRRLLLIL